MSLSTSADGIVRFTQVAVHRLAALSPGEIILNLVLSGLAVAAALGAGFALHRLLGVGLRRLPREETANQVRSSGALRLGWAIIKFALAAGAAYTVLGVWGFDPLAWSGGAAGRGLIRVAGRLALLAVIFAAAFELTGLAVRRTMARLAAGARDPRRAAQLRTLSPLLGGVLRSVIVIMGAMMLLSELGVKIGPLLAGAGVAGIAVGFGAQSLVKDVLTGFFLIIEDIVSVGDTIRIDTSKGEVEQMTLRTIRLRDFDGTLHVFPYGEAQVIHNETKTFSYAVIDLQISYDSDVDAALAAMRRVGDDLAADDEFRGEILSPIDVLGVETLKENGPQLKARIKTRPGADAGVQREFNRRIKQAFDTEGVVIPYPHMRLVLPGNETKSA